VADTGTTTSRGIITGMVAEEQDGIRHKMREWILRNRFIITIVLAAMLLVVLIFTQLGGLPPR